MAFARSLVIASAFISASIIALTACSGGGGGGSIPLPIFSPLTASTAIATAAPAKAPASALPVPASPILGGVIAGVTSNQIAIQGPSGCSYVSVSYTSSTQINLNGLTLTPGVFASVYGSGSCATSFVATKISLSTTTIAVAGTIHDATSSAITLQGVAGCGAVTVSYDSSTAIFANGYSLAAGAYATVYGTGNCAASFTATRIVLSSASGASPSPSATASPSPTATPSPTPIASPVSTPAPPPAVLHHVLTGDYCCGGYANDTPAGGLATAKPWITYYANPSANGDSTGTNPSYGTPGLASAGISPANVYVYVDDSRIYNGDAQYSNIAPGGAYASAEAKDCLGNPITVNNHGGYLSDPYQPATVFLYNNDVTRNYNYSSEYGLVFLDDITGYLYNDGGAMPCSGGFPFAQPSTATAYASLIAAISTSGLNHSAPGYILNALYPMIAEANGSASTLTASIGALVAAGTVVGLDCESCLADGSNPIIGNNTSGELAGQWTLVEDAEIALVNAHKIFWLQDQDTRSTGATSYAGRLFAFASFMLTWDPTYTVYQNAYYGWPGDGAHANSTNPQIHVFPEEALVAYNPLVAYPGTTSGIGALQDSGGTYVREYQSCYYAGAAIGACAFVVNPDSAAHNKPALRGSYTHTLVISTQSDVLDGGTVSFTGPVIPSTVGATSAYILLP